MHVNPRTSMDAARRLVQHTHKRIIGKTQRIDRQMRSQQERHQREQRDRPEPRDEDAT